MLMSWPGVDQDMSREIEAPSKDGKPEQRFFGNETYRKRKGRKDYGDIQDAGVIGNEDVRAAFFNVLKTSKA